MCAIETVIYYAITPLLRRWYAYRDTRSLSRRCVQIQRSTSTIEPLRAFLIEIVGFGAAREILHVSTRIVVVVSAIFSRRCYHMPPTSYRSRDTDGLVKPARLADVRGTRKQVRDIFARCICTNATRDANLIVCYILLVCLFVYLSQGKSGARRLKPVPVAWR